MSVELQQIIAFVAFGAVLLLVNLLASDGWLKPITLFPALASIAFAGWLLLDWAVLA